MKIPLFIVSTLLFVSAGAQSKRVWTLKECVDYALEHNFQAAQAGISTANAKADLLQSKLNMLPSVNGSMSHNYNIGRSIDPYTNTFQNQNVQSNNFSLSGNLVLFNGLQNQNSIKSSRNMFLGNQSSEVAIKNDVALQVCQAYLTVLLNQELLAINEEQLGVTRKQLERNRILFDAGRVNQSAVLDVEAQQATEEVNLVNARNNLNAAYLSLWQVMQYQTTSDSISPVMYDSATLISAQTYSVSDLFAINSKNAPQMRAAYYNFDAARYQLKTAQGGRSPRLSLNAQIGTLYTESYKSATGYTLLGSQLLYVDLNGNPVYAPLSIPSGTYVTPFGDQTKNNLSKFFGVTMTIPIFNGYQVATGITKAKNNVDFMRYSLESAENKLFQEIARAVSDYESAKANINSSRNSYKANKTSFDYAEIRNKEGLLNDIEFSVIKGNFARSRISLKQAEFQYLFRLKVLEYYKEGTIKF